MGISLSATKILQTNFEKIISNEELVELLITGKFYEFEQILYSQILGLYDNVCKSFIRLVSFSPEHVSSQKKAAVKRGLKKLEFRKASIQLRTGTKIKHASLYAKQAPSTYEGSRHLSSILWQTELSCSPMYKSISCLFSVICPSFEVSKSLLRYQNIKSNYERIRQVSLGLAESCIANRSSIQLSKGETLADQKVVIAMDGGRTRTRVYEKDKVGRKEKYTTQWREPKMFVIATCDDQGKLNKDCKPIYDTTFGDDEIFELLTEYLTNLQIDKAKSVQFLADGAPWIWNRVKPMLIGLGVEEDKIIETLDYYHAVEHLHEMKIYFDQGEQKECFTELKQALWEGNIEEMGQLIKRGIKDVDLEKFNPFKYFKKLEKQIDYQSLKESNRPCGSGIIESAIRRIVNLRFKSPSSFWYPENVEKLMFMRGVALSGRWEIMMNNKFA